MKPAWQSTMTCKQETSFCQALAWTQRWAFWSESLAPQGWAKKKKRKMCNIRSTKPQNIPRDTQEIKKGKKNDNKHKVQPMVSHIWVHLEDPDQHWKGNSGSTMFATVTVANNWIDGAAVGCSLGQHLQQPEFGQTSRGIPNMETQKNISGKSLYFDNSLKYVHKHIAKYFKAKYSPIKQKR